MPGHKSKWQNMDFIKSVREPRKEKNMDKLCPDRSRNVKYSFELFPDTSQNRKIWQLHTSYV